MKVSGYFRSKPAQKAGSATATTPLIAIRS
jgi:hypothetical protein